MYLIILSLALPILVFVIIRLLKNKFSPEKLKAILIVIGIVCCVLSAIAIALSTYFSKDFTNLFKLSLPLLILIIILSNRKKI